MLKIDIQNAKMIEDEERQDEIKIDDRGGM
jgi:hypothetical protein